MTYLVSFSDTFSKIFVLSSLDCLNLYIGHDFTLQFRGHNIDIVIVYINLLIIRLVFFKIR